MPTGRPTHTDKGRSPNSPAENPVATAAGLGFAVGNIVAGLGLWLASLLPSSAPDLLVTGAQGTAVALGATVAVAIGRYTQRFTIRVYDSVPPE